MPDNGFIAGDTASTLRVPCKDKVTGDVIDLSGCAVTLNWFGADGSVVSRVMTVEAPATDGVASYQFASGELIAPAMVFQVKVVDVATKILRNVNDLSIPVGPAIA